MNIFKYNYSALILDKNDDKSEQSTVQKIEQLSAKLQPSEGDSEIHPLKKKIDKFDLFQQLQKEKEIEENDEGHTIHSDHLFDAWCKFRPIAPYKETESGKSKSSQGGDSKRSILKKQQARSQLLDVSDIFGPLLVN